jgi:hypothetical protein
MTSLKRRWSVKTRRTLRAWRQPFEAIATAAGRLFSPRDDDYPKIGAQPFEGDIPDARYRYHASW